MLLNGEIANLYFQTVDGIDERFNAVFYPYFQDPEKLASFLSRHLGSSIVDSFDLKFMSVETFQAAFILCWLHHPSEKGSYMIDLSQLPKHHIKSLMERLLNSRMWGSKLGTSHLSQRGFSAAKNWKFLKHYNELLIQIETVGNRPFLFLKAEGHTTHGLDLIMHAISFAAAKLGNGKTASKKLHAIAEEGRVDERSAENFSKGYKALLNKLGLAGKLITVETMFNQLHATLEKMGVANLPENDEAPLGEKIEKLLRQDRSTNLLSTLRLDAKHLDSVRLDLEKIVRFFEISEEALASSRLFQEVQVTPDQLDSTHRNVLRIIKYWKRLADAA